MSGDTKPGTQLALVNRFAARVGVEPAVFKRTIKATVLKTKDREATDEEMVAFLAIADKYGLDPWTKEIHAFVDKGGGIVPVVGVDGWNHLEQTHPQFAGERVEMPPREEWIQIDEDAKPCPPWITVTIKRSDHGEQSVTEYLDECYKPAYQGSGRDGKYKIKGPWQTHTKRMLRHKARIQAIREVLSYGGIYDEDEAARIIASSEQADPYVGGAEVYAEAEVCIDAEALAELLALAARKGLSREQLERQLRAKGKLSGALEAIGESVHGEIMAALARMADKAAPPPPEPAAAPATEPEVLDAEEGADFWPAGEAAPAPPSEPEEEDIPGVGADEIDNVLPAAQAKATQRQLAKIAALLKETGADIPYVQAWMREQWGITSRSQLSKDQAGMLIEHLSSQPSTQGALDEGAA